MQQWEYKVLHRVRPIGGAHVGAWDESIVSQLPSLGDEGWELITVITRASQPGNVTAGVTSDEMWVFKRLKSSAANAATVVVSEAAPVPESNLDDLEVVTRPEPAERDG